MNKKEIVLKVSENTGLTQKQTAAVVDEILKAIVEAVAQGDKVQFVDFGTFEQKTRKARSGINPLTKAPVDIPESKVPQFKAGKKFKEAVNK